MELLLNVEAHEGFVHQLLAFEGDLIGEAVVGQAGVGLLGEVEEELDLVPIRRR